MTGDGASRLDQAERATLRSSNDALLEEIEHNQKLLNLILVKVVQIEHALRDIEQLSALRETAKSNANLGAKRSRVWTSGAEKDSIYREVAQQIADGEASVAAAARTVAKRYGISGGSVQNIYYQKRRDRMKDSDISSHA